MMTKEELQTLKQSVMQSKQSWNSVFYDTFAYTQPERNYVWRAKGGNPGNLKQVELFTTAGKIGTAVFVSRIQNKLSPYEKPYFSLKCKESVEDDVESEISLSSKPEDTLFSLSDDNNVIYLNTFSKTISSSLRIGYMVLPKRLVGMFDERLGFYSCTVPAFEQYVVARLIQNGDFARHINRVRRYARKEIQENIKE